MSSLTPDTRSVPRSGFRVVVVTSGPGVPSFLDRVWEVVNDPGPYYDLALGTRTPQVSRTKFRNLERTHSGARLRRRPSPPWLPRPSDRSSVRSCRVSNEGWEYSENHLSEARRYHGVLCLYGGSVTLERHTRSGPKSQVSRKPFCLGRGRETDVVWTLCDCKTRDTPYNDRRTRAIGPCQGPGRDHNLLTYLLTHVLTYSLSYVLFSLQP